MRLPCDLRKGALKERRIPWTVEMPLATHESGTGCGFSMWPYAQAGKDGAALMDTTMATWESLRAQSRTMSAEKNVRKNFSSASKNL